jgi:hypothetical protein
MLERKILIGLITSTEFIQQIQHAWNISYLESQMAKRLAGWCMEYFQIYNKAPNKDIEAIYYEKLREGLPKDIAEEIEQDILPGLSREFEDEEINIDYLRDQTLKFFKEKQLLNHSEQIKDLTETGELLEAEKLACEFKPVLIESKTDLNLNSDAALLRIEKAFNDTNQPVITYPGALGEFWNNQLIKGAFVALMGMSKRGKTFWLLELALRAVKQGKKVVFFQAGDMTESQLLRRICIYLTRKSDKERYCGKMYEPVRDCVKNQLDLCDNDRRECQFGLFSDKTEKQIRKEITIDELIKQYKENTDYKHCYNCYEYTQNRWGSVWINEVEVKNHLTVKEAQQAVSEFFIKFKRNFKISTHANGTLTIKKAITLLDIWDKSENFNADLIAFDYADIMEDEYVKEFRHKQNAIWKGMRRISQEKNEPLVITGTQTDADSFEANKLKLKNFTEDRRKYDHVTAMYGLNQDKNDREKRLKVMRINELVIREGEFFNNNEVTVLQNLQRGRPFISSYF